MSSKLVTCDRCNGEKILPHFMHIEGGVCFKCEGAGEVEESRIRGYFFINLSTDQLMEKARKVKFQLDTVEAKGREAKAQNNVSKLQYFRKLWTQRNNEYKSLVQIITDKMNEEEQAQE